jgi:prolyl-tRNA synthetase
MLWSKLFIPTLRENPAEADAAHHRLLLRAGYMRQIGSGNYAYLTLGQRTLRRIERIVRAEMEGIGAQEFLFPPDKTVSSIARGELRSSKQLPQIWYQIQSQSRDALRMKSDPLHACQSLMLDSQSIDADAPAMDLSASRHSEAFSRIFARCGLRVVPTENDFMLPSDAGDDVFVHCDACGYAASIDTAISRASVLTVDDPPGDHTPEEFYTPNRKTIVEVSEFAQVPATSQMKSLVMTARGEGNNDKPLLALVRGDRQVSRPKLAAILRVREVVPAPAAAIREWFGADPGSLGPVGINMRIIADHSLAGRRNMIAGANKNDYHLRNVTPGRDFEAEFLDIRRVSEGDKCSSCGAGLVLRNAIRIAQLRKQPAAFTGSYELAIERILYALIELNNDDAGMFLPAAIAPFEVIITPVNIADVPLRDASRQIYDDCLASRIDALYDDRDERPGSKFKDADLTGVPYRITLGKKLAQGFVEFSDRSARSSRDVPVSEIISELRKSLG